MAFAYTTIHSDTFKHKNLYKLFIYPEQSAEGCSKIKINNVH